VGGSQGGSQGESQGGRGRVVKYYILLGPMYRKYVGKWRLLKSNRIICPGIAVNSQFLPGKSKFLRNLP